MKWLFIYAHPDDESVAAGGTIRKLVDFGDEVELVLATGGDAGELDESAKMEREKFGSLKELRMHELDNACRILGIKNFKVLDFVDGEITNEEVWGKMTEDLVEIIDKKNPDVVVSFDHGGWYYHLDHVGVSVATMRAVHKAKNQVELFMQNPFHPPGIREKWNYMYPKEQMISHKVDVSDVVSVRLKAFQAHASQNIGLIERLNNGEMNEECFLKVKSTKKGDVLLSKREFFEPIS